MHYIKLTLDVIFVSIFITQAEGEDLPQKCRQLYSSGSLSKPCSGYCNICRKYGTINQCDKIAKWVDWANRPFILSTCTKATSSYSGCRISTSKYFGCKKSTSTYCTVLKHCPYFCKCSPKETCVNLFAACKCECSISQYGQGCEKIIPAGLSLTSFADVENIIYEPYVYSNDFAQFKVFLYLPGKNLKVIVKSERELLTFNWKHCIKNLIPSQEYCRSLFENKEIEDIDDVCNNKNAHKSYLESQAKACSLSINLAFPRSMPNEGNKNQYIPDYPGNTSANDTVSIDNIVAKSELVTISIFNEIENVSHQIFSSTYSLMVIYVGKSLIEKCNPLVKINQFSSSMYNMNTFSRRQEITLTSSVVMDESPLCVTFGEPTLNWFVWTVTENHDEQNDLPNVYEGSFLAFPAFSLKYGVYKVKHEVILNTNYFSSGTSYCYFKIVPLPLDPSVFGGSLRYIYYKDNLELITAPSTDPNHPLFEQPLLEYVWYCNDTNDRICERREVKSSFNIWHMLVLAVPSPFTPGKVYNFTMEVVSRNSPEVESSNQVIVISQDPIPSLLIKCVKNCGGKYFKTNVKEMVFLRVQHSQYSASITKKFTYNWTYSTGNESDISTENIHLFEKTPSWILLIKENVLTNDELYTFRVLGGGEPPGEAQITISTGGSNVLDTVHCTIVPKSGVAGISKFRVTCTNDGGGQMLFTLYEKSSDDNKTGRLLRSTYTGVVENLILTQDQVFVLATNVYGESIETTVSVTLQPVNFTTGFLNDSLTKLDKVKRFQSFEQKVSFISAVEDILDQNTTAKQVAMVKFLEILSQETVSNAIELELLLSATLSVICYKENCTMPPINRQSYQYLVQILPNVSDKLTQILTDLSDANSELLSEEAKRLIVQSLKCADVVLNAQDKFNEEKDYSVYKLYKYGNSKIIKSMVSINNALAVRNLPYSKGTFLQSESIDFYMREQSPNYFTNTKNNSLIQVSSELAGALSEVHKTIVLQTMNFKSNPFWWAFADEVTTQVLSLDIGFVKRDVNTPNDQQYRSIRVLKYPIDILLDKNTLKKELIHGTIRQPVPTNDPDVNDLAVVVYKIYPPKGSEVSVKFTNLSENDVFKIAIELNQRPNYDVIQKRGINITALSPWYIFSHEIINDDDFVFIGILPGSNIAVGKLVNYTFELQSARCQFWNNVAWSTSGCKLGNASTEHHLHCRCNHLSFISGLLKVPMNTVNPFEDYKLFLTIPDNPYVFALISTIFIVYIILLIWACKKDQEDRQKTSLVILEDNLSSDLFGFLLIVCTGSRLFAGTSSNIGIILHGTQFSSRSHILRSSKRATLKRGSDDWFLLYVPEYLGIISSIQLWTDHSGPTPNWFCDRIYIHDLHSKDDYTFVVGQWFGITQAEICVEKFVRPITFEKDIYFSAYFLTNTISGFRENHQLVSVLGAYPRSPVSKAQRLSIVMVSLIVTLLTSVMFYEDKSPQVEDVPSYQITNQEVLISIYSLITAAIISSLVAFPFKKSYVKKKISQTSNVQVKTQQKIKVDRLREGNVTRGSGKNLSIYYLHKIILSIRKQNFFPIKSETEAHEYIAVHKTRAALAWIICLTVIIINSYIIILYGLKFGKVKSLLWMTSIGLSVMQDNFVVDPLKIVIISVLFGILEAQFCDMYTYDPNIHDIRNKSSLKLQTNVDINVLNLRLKPFYKHVSRQKLNDMQIKQRKIQKWWTLIDIFDICFPVLFIFLVVSWFSYAYYTNSLFERVIVQSQETYASAPMTQNCTEYLEHVENIILPAIYSTIWYNKLSLTSDLEAFEDTGWTVDATHRMMGVPRIRQLRVRKQHCNTPQVLQHLSANCNIRFSLSTEDTRNYGSYWKASPNGVISNKSPWKYHSPENSSSVTIGGKSGQSFHGGGYLVELSRTQTKSDDIIFNLIDTNWLDSRTSVIFLEMTVYSVNLNAFSSFIYITEALDGKLISENVQVMTFFPRNEYILLEILGLLFSILALAKLFMVFNTIGMSFFWYFWPVYDLILILVGLTCLLGYRIFLVNASIYITSFQRSGKDAFFQFQKLFISLNTELNLLMVLFIFISVRLLRLFNYGNRNISRVQIRTIYITWHQIFWVTLLLVFFLFGIWQILSLTLCGFFHYENIRNVEPMDRKWTNICTYLPYTFLNLAVLICTLVIVKGYTQASNMKK